jgi:hypothetical protein
MAVPAVNMIGALPAFEFIQINGNSSLVLFVVIDEAG